jgi:invasion protein IalB
MKIFSACVLFCAALTTAAGAQTAAPTAPPITITGWRVECDSLGAALNCRLTDQVTQAGSGLVIAALGIAIATDTKKPVLTLQLPLGLAVSDPVTLSADTATQPYTLVTCDRAGCFARAPIGDALLEKMRAAKTPFLKVQYNVIGPTLVKSTVTLQMPLTGFDASLDKIK